MPYFHDVISPQHELFTFSILFTRKSNILNFLRVYVCVCKTPLHEVLAAEDGKVSYHGGVEQCIVISNVLRGWQCMSMLPADDRYSSEGKEKAGCKQNSFQDFKGFKMICNIENILSLKDTMWNTACKQICVRHAFLYAFFTACILTYRKGTGVTNNINCGYTLYKCRSKPQRCDNVTVSTTAACWSSHCDSALWYITSQGPHDFNKLSNLIFLGANSSEQFCALYCVEYTCT